ncbi:radical SAM protein [Magnetospirillum sp. SS-4]|uniref:radical SAM/SPASM domain-containing protein n=1 Tax=Magnetospirillum sp. SS-4 TaxID=2681465 RepID=UPI0013811541|nr:radical SAM protein [Magnetospirillum sp. SS-4]CAA7614862.1 putative Fe-S oxidoreductase [Magnetospirillum sp. SS-4]
MFRLTLRQPDGETFGLILDIHGGKLMDQEGRRIDLSPLGAAYLDGGRFAVAPSTSPIQVAPKSRRVERLRLQLGLKCNFACSYCMQAADRDGDIRTSGTAEGFLAGLDWLDGAPGEIEFWGGEPLAYWKILKPLAEGLRTRFPEAVFKLITNGSLLDKAKVDWLDRLGFVVSISHDGPGQHQRGPDPFEDPEAAEAIRLLFRTLGSGRCSFLSVLTMAHHSPAALVAYFVDRVGEDVQVSIEGMVTPHDVAGILMSPMSEGDHRRVRRTLFDEFRMPSVFHRNLVLSPLQSLLRQFATGMPSEARGQNCGMDRPGHLAVTLGGQALVCQNVNQDKVIGNVHDFDSIRLTHSTSWHHRPECHACPVLATCGGSCMMVEGMERKVACDNAFSLGLARLALLLNVLTGAELLRIEGERIRFPGITHIDF